MDEFDKFTGLIAANKISLTPEQIVSFRKFWALIRQGNKAIQLVSNHDLNIIPSRHFFDSLTPLCHNLIAQGSNVADLGTGGGLPGIPLAICRPDLELMLIDSIRRKISFVRHAVRSLGLENIQMLAERIEVSSTRPEHASGFDVCVSRALTSLETLIEWGIPFLKPGGILICYKGPEPMEEIQAASETIKQCNCEIEQVIPLHDLDRESNRCLVVVRKNS